MKPIENQNTITIAANFGTNVRVISWIDVSAWNNPITKPVINATDKIGTDTITATQSPARNVSKNMPSVSILHRHPQNFLIGLDHFVAHRHCGFDRQFGLRQRQHQRVRVGVTAHC